MMTDDSRKATLAGLLILLSIFAAVGIIIATANTDALLRQRRSYTAAFPAGSDVQGLDDKSLVRILGVDVGGVQKVAVETDDAGQPRVLVTFWLPAEYDLRRNAAVTVQSQITGGARLNIETLGDGAALAADDVLEGYTLTIGDVMARLDGLMPKASTGLESFTKTSDDIGQLVRDVHGKVDGVVERYHAVMKTADAALANARDILGDTKTDIRGAMANINQMTDTAAEQLPDVLKDARELMSKARASLAKLEPILDDGKAVTAQVRDTLNDNRANIDQTMTNVRRASVELKGGVAEIRRAPWRLLNEPDEKDQRNLELYEAARRFADGAHDLQAAALSIELAAADPNTDAEELEAMRAELADQIARFVEARQKLWERFER
jgi:ABC-type transporter Mla subunit MlaD